MVTENRHLSLREIAADFSVSHELIRTILNDCLGMKLKSIPENAFKKCFDEWIIRWHKCIISRGAYFEGDKINLDK